jgi:hypothetical protein
VASCSDALLAGTLSRATARKVLVSLKSLLKGARYGHLADGVVIKNGKRERRLELAKDIPTPDETSACSQWPRARGSGPCCSPRR